MRQSVAPARDLLDRLGAPDRGIRAVLVSGTNPQSDSYTLEGPAPSAPITALRLDAMTHASLPERGPGRYADGEFVLAGETNLMNFAELSDVDTLRRLFDTFSRKRLMLDLLDRSINADGVQVFIGAESGFGILDDCSVVTAPYQLDDETVGVLGVIGPTRMAYDRVVPIVDITARLLKSALS
jgi:heat-inducible transcriptional repressor